LVQGEIHPLDMVRDWTRFAPQLQIPDIEWLGHEHVSSHEQQLARLNICGIGIGSYDELALTRVKRSGVDTLLIWPIAQG
jgi:hypothetical protein